MTAQEQRADPLGLRAPAEAVTREARSFTARSQWARIRTRSARMANWASS